MKRFLIFIFLLCSIGLISGSVNAQTADFEDLSLNADSYWNGSDETGGFFSGGFSFNNNYVYDPNYPSWGGFAYSNKTDTLPDGFVAQYNAITGSGVDGSEIYAIGYYDAYNQIFPTIALDEEQIISGAYFTNNNYAFYSMTNGDGFAKKFTDGDWFKVTITGIDANGSETGKVEFNLADGANIVDRWTWVDLNSLGTIKQLTFELSSTDNTDYGYGDSMNTPAYFCMDNFNYDDSSDDSTCFIHTMNSEFMPW